jgi:Ni/Fe-hydrogenase 1 B-type cytochrome subunit
MSAAPSLAVPAEPSASVYVWELPVRITHWLIFLSIMLLAVTGFYIGDPFIAVAGRARDHFVMGTVRVIHLYAAIVFTLAVLVRVYWMFVGNRYARWSEFLPLTRRRLRSTWQTMRFYSFVRRDPPPYPGHSGLAGATYTILFLLYFLMIASGLTLYTIYASPASPFQFFRFLIPVFGGLQPARLLHHIGMWLLLIFMVHHTYSVILFSVTRHRGIFDSMISGYKRAADETEESGEG